MRSQSNQVRIAIDSKITDGEGLGKHLTLRSDWPGVHIRHIGSDANPPTIYGLPVELNHGEPPDFDGERTVIDGFQIYEVSLVVRDGRIVIEPAVGLRSRSIPLRGGICG